MALGTPTHRGFGSGATAGTTGSFTPAANDLLIAVVGGRRNTTVPVQPTISDSASLTWTEIVDVQYNPGANPRTRARVFWARVGASPSSMTVTGTISDATTTGVSVFSISGASSTITNIKSVTNAAGDPSLTLDSSPAAASGVMGLYVAAGTATVNPPTGFTEINESQASTNMMFETAYDITSPTAGPHAWSTLNNETIGILVEIAEIPVATGDASITLGAITTSAAAVQTTPTDTARFLLAGAPLGELPLGGSLSISNNRTGEASLTLGAFTTSAAGAVQVKGDASITLGAVTVAGSGSEARFGDASITLGAITTGAAGAVQVKGAASLTLGAITVQGESGGAPIDFPPQGFAATQVPVIRLLGNIKASRVQ